MASLLAVGLVCLSPAALPLKVAVALPVVIADSGPQPVFLIERSVQSERYSNGLEIRNEHVTTSVPRRYRTFSVPHFQRSERKSRPAGIVFHTTESHLLPLQSGLRISLNRTREELLQHVQNNRSYNFVVDRFGQVFRVVPEDQVALHAGHSIWSDDSDLFIDLNESFLGVAFEARTGEGTTPAQLHSGQMLTAYLRSSFSIPDEDCVTHAQVSVNPDTLRIGYHTDWAADFPFQQIGLAAGYHARVASVAKFGFVYDETFLAAISGHPWPGLLAAENQILIDAAAKGFTPARYRTFLQQQYPAIRRLNNERS